MPSLSFFTKGLYKKSIYYNEENLIKYRNKMNVSVLCLPSENSKTMYQKIYSTNVDTKFLYDCSPITDCYFDEIEINNSKKKVNSIINTKGKKIIGYINYMRYRNDVSQYIQSLNLNELKSKISDEYVILIINIKNERVDYVGNKFSIHGFSKDVTGKLSIRELMIASDIIVSDYSDVALEAPILARYVASAVANAPLIPSGWS